jgi:hypothetical protein
MINRIQTELDHERQVYAKRKAEGRTDYIALALLSRIEREIKILEYRLQHEQKKAKYRNTGKTIYNVKEAVCRYWTHCYGYYNAVLRILGFKALQKARGVK